MSEWVNGAVVFVDAESAAPSSSSLFGAALQVVDRARGEQHVACQVLTNRARAFCCGNGCGPTGEVASGDVNANDAVTSAHSARYVASIVAGAIASCLVG